MSEGAEVVLMEPDAENRIPSDEEIIEYAEFLGIDVDREPWLMWIAREGVVAPVPPPWKACTQTGDDLFYFNFETGESIWEHPSDQKYTQLVVEQRQKGPNGQPTAQELLNRSSGRPGIPEEESESDDETGIPPLPKPADMHTKERDTPGIVNPQYADHSKSQSDSDADVEHKSVSSDANISLGSDVDDPDESLKSLSKSAEDKQRGTKSCSFSGDPDSSSSSIGRKSHHSKKSDTNERKCARELPAAGSSAVDDISMISLGNESAGNERLRGAPFPSPASHDSEERSNVGDQERSGHDVVKEFSVDQSSCSEHAYGKGPASPNAERSANIVSGAMAACNASSGSSTPASSPAISPKAAEVDRRRLELITKELSDDEVSVDSAQQDQHAGGHQELDRQPTQVAEENHEVSDDDDVENLMLRSIQGASTDSASPESRRHGGDPSTGLGLGRHGAGNAPSGKFKGPAEDNAVDSKAVFGAWRGAVRDRSDTRAALGAWQGLMCQTSPKASSHSTPDVEEEDAHDASLPTPNDSGTSPSGTPAHNAVPEKHKDDADEHSLPLPGNQGASPSRTSAHSERHKEDHEDPPSLPMPSDQGASPSRTSAHSVRHKDHEDPPSLPMPSDQGASPNRTTAHSERHKDHEDPPSLLMPNDQGASPNRTTAHSERHKDREDPPSLPMPNDQGESPTQVSRDLNFADMSRDLGPKQVSRDLATRPVSNGQGGDHKIQGAHHEQMVPQKFAHNAHHLPLPGVKQNLEMPAGHRTEHTAGADASRYKRVQVQLESLSRSLKMLRQIRKDQKEYLELLQAAGA